jgi:hypothetical protein
MDKERVLYAIAESCPFDALLVRDMRRSVDSLLQLNLRRFRLPQKEGTKYSALDVMKQALELVFEFSPSERNYREAMRTIQVYSEGDEEMLHMLQESFYLITNAVYSAYSGQRHVESLSPDILFLQGTLFDPVEIRQSFRFVGVKPPAISPPTVRKTVFLDEGFQPYGLMLEGKLMPHEAQLGREEHWAKLIETHLADAKGTALIRAGANHVDQAQTLFKQLQNMIHRDESGKLPRILQRKGIQIKVVHRIADVNLVLGKS